MTEKSNSCESGGGQREGSKATAALVGANLIVHSKVKTLDGLNIPTAIAIYAVSAPEATAFDEYAVTTLYVLPSKSSLRPVFKDEDFEPR